jgi:hypothetical protein
MTEAEWLRSNDVDSMVNFVERRASERKMRLFGCACCRRIWDLLTDSRLRSVVELAEQYADGSIDQEEFRAAVDKTWPSGPVYEIGQIGAAIDAVGEVIWIKDVYGAAYHVRMLTYNAFFAADESADERVTQCRLLRDVFGNPFRPVTLDDRWRTANVLDLARTIYEGRTFDRLPILADALMDAGCDSEEILSHCRGPGPHVRGCWVVDLVLGKE